MQLLSNPQSPDQIRYVARKLCDLVAKCSQSFTRPPTSQCYEPKFTRSSHVPKFVRVACAGGACCDVGPRVVLPIRTNIYVRTYVHSEPSRIPACRRFMSEGESTGKALPQAVAQLQILATLNDPEAPSKDGDEDELKPGKAQDLVTLGLKNDDLVSEESDSRIETHAATLQLPCVSSSCKKYIVRFQGKNSKKWDGREISVDEEWLESLYDPKELTGGKQLHLPWPEKGGEEKYWNAVFIDPKLPKSPDNACFDTLSGTTRKRKSLSKTPSKKCSTNQKTEKK